MHDRLLLRRVNLLPGPGQVPCQRDVLLEQGLLSAGLDQPIRDPEGLPTLEASGWWLAPPLVDPHSVLEDPVRGRAETLRSLEAAALAGGYGSVGILPWAPNWRDRPARLDWGQGSGPCRYQLWGSFSLDGADLELAPHADQLESGAVGLAAGDGLPPLGLLERGLRLAEMGDRPVLIAPRDASLGQLGFVRERVEALRAGWPPDPVVSETLPLQTLLALAEALPEAPLRLMNLSTAEGVALLGRHTAPPPASVCWWHLLADSGGLDPAAEGWRLVPSLGGPSDREALIEAVAAGRITAVAVHHLPLDAEERLLPLDQRRPGLAGHGLALSLLWQELVAKRGWSPVQLWQALCWGPSAFMALPPEQLETGSPRWVLFDPQLEWQWNGASCPSQAANQPCWNQPVKGRVVASGLTAARDWLLPDPGAPLR